MYFLIRFSVLQYFLALRSFTGLLYLVEEFSLHACHDSGLEISTKIPGIAKLVPMKGNGISINV